MEPRRSLAWGALLAILGGVGIVFSIIFGWTALPSPWDFLLGFVLGILSGLGCALSVYGLIIRKRGP